MVRMHACLLGGMAQMHTLDDWYWRGQLGWLPLEWWGMTGMAAVAFEMVGRRLERLGLGMALKCLGMGLVLKRM